MDKNIYRKGFIAQKSGLKIIDNPYSERSEIQKYYEWAAGFNDAEMGYII